MHFDCKIKNRLCNKKYGNETVIKIIFQCSAVVWWLETLSYSNMTLTHIKFCSMTDQPLTSAASSAYVINFQYSKISHFNFYMQSDRINVKVGKNFKIYLNNLMIKSNKLLQKAKL